MRKRGERRKGRGEREERGERRQEHRGRAICCRREAVCLQRGGEPERGGWEDSALQGPLPASLKTKSQEGQRWFGGLVCVLMDSDLCVWCCNFWITDRLWRVGRDKSLHASLSCYKFFYSQVQNAQKQICCSAPLVLSELCFTVAVLHCACSKTHPQAYSAHHTKSKQPSHSHLHSAPAKREPSIRADPHEAQVSASR